MSDKPDGARPTDLVTVAEYGSAEKAAHALANELRRTVEIWERNPAPLNGRRDVWFTDDEASGREARRLGWILLAVALPHPPVGNL